MCVWVRDTESETDIECMVVYIVEKNDCGRERELK